MVIGYRLRELREAKGLNQADISKRTGLTMPYVSRAENDRSVPSIGALEKWARALEIPLYAFFYDNAPLKPAVLPSTTKHKGSRKDARFMRMLCHLLARMEEQDRQFLLQNARWMANRKRPAHK